MGARRTGLNGILVCWCAVLVNGGCSQQASPVPAAGSAVAGSGQAGGSPAPSIAGGNVSVPQGSDFAGQPAALDGDPMPPNPLGSVREGASGDEKLLLLRQLTEAAMNSERELRFADAVNDWQKVHSLLAQTSGPKSWQVRNCELAMGTARQQAGFSPAQLAAYRQLVQEQRLIAAALEKADYAAALKAVTGTAPSTESLFGRDSWMFALQLVQTGRLQQLNGLHPAAIETLRSASEAVLILAGPLHPELENIHAFLAGSFAAVGERNLMLANLKKAAVLAHDLWGENSLQYATRANELGVAYNESRDYNTAIRVLQASETIRASALGPNHPLVAHSRLNLSIAMLGLGDLPQALALVDSAEKPLREGKPQPDLLVTCLRQKSALLMLLERPAEAEPALRELLQFARGEVANDGGAIQAELQYRLAVCLARQNRADEAIAEAQASLAAWARLVGPDNQRTTRTRDLLISLFERTGQSARAAELKGAVQPATFESPDRTSSGNSGTNGRSR